ncbi:MAG: universal stress protein [Desulfobacterales bacterium]
MFHTPKIAKILFATDLSENAGLALNYAMSIAEAFGANITVLHVFEKIPPNAEMVVATFLGYEDLDEFRKKSEKELMRQIGDRIEQFCTNAAGQVSAECRITFNRVIVESGKAVDRILHHTETGGYDVLVVGSRGLGLFQETFMGGTSRKVLHHCKIPVLVIPS